MYLTLYIESRNTPKRNSKIPIAKNAKPSSTNTVELPLPKKGSPLRILLMPLVRKTMLVISISEPITKATLDISNSEVSM
jgi:hypothetical protein